MTETKCWSCANEAFTKCPWVLLGQAIKGWKAEETTVIGKDKIKSYLVMDCPNYIQDNRTKKASKPKAKSKCKFCGKELSGWKTFCNIECYKTYHRKKEVEKNKEEYCFFCGRHLCNGGVETPFKRMGSDQYARAHKACYGRRKNEERKAH